MSLADDRAFARAMLPRVSRTFALGIRLLPARLGTSVGTAYLLCRIADTIEDSAELAPARRQSLLHTFADTLDGVPDGVAGLAAAFADRPDDEARLVVATGRILRVFAALPEPDRAAIRPWVQEMARGMGAFAALPEPAAHGVTVLASVADLDRYCYYVAGTVGHMLTALYRVHDRRIDEARFARLDALATSFGLGLQLTNIVKDVADDRRRGWSFVPADLCREAGIDPGALADPAHAAEAHQVMLALIAKARGHLDDALRYCLLLPRGAWRIRIFCLTALYFAVATLRRAGRDPRLLDPTHKVKITRAEVYRTVALTHAIAPSNALVRGYYHRLAT